MGAARRAIKRMSGATSTWSRERKLAWLLQRIEPGATVLLVGVTVRRGRGVGTGNFVERGIVEHAKATALVYEKDGAPDLDCPFVRGSALELPFENGAFDYVVSNAVIEHVGGTAPAARMVSESRRVAKRAAFHTTPYRWFPIETHTQLPLLHWLPRRYQHAAFVRAGKPHFNSSDYWLFGRRGLKQLAPGARVSSASAVSLVAEWPAHGAGGS